MSARLQSWAKWAGWTLLAVASIFTLLVNAEPIATFQQELVDRPSAAFGSYTLMFIGFCLIQLLIIPTGTALLLITGAVFGPIVGALYFLAMLTVTPIVFWFAKTHPRSMRRAIIRYSPGRRVRTLLVSGLSAMRNKPIVAASALRLMPVVPSAGACILAGLAGLSLRSLITGTILTGPIRPLAIATIGSFLGTVAFQPDAESNAVLLWLTVFSIGTLAGSLILVRKLLPSALFKTPTSGPILRP